MAHAQSPAPDSAAPYDALVEVLENEQTRNQLIEQLQLLAEQPAVPTDANKAGVQADASDLDSAQTPSKTKELADTTRFMATSLGGQFHSLANVIQSLVMGDEEAVVGSFDSKQFLKASINLGLVIIATWIIFGVCAA